MSEPAAPAARPPQITAALVEAMKAVGRVGKNGRNTDQNFRYRKYDDIITAANAALVEAGVAITPTIVSLEREQRQVTTKSQARRTVTTTVVNVNYELACAADGSSKTINWYGEASDYGDKSLGKALSYAEKMMLIEVLKIPVDDPDADADPDGHSHAEDTPADAPRPQRQRQRPHRARPEPGPVPPAESDDALHAEIIERINAVSEDPEAEGGMDTLKKIWADVEHARLEKNAWSVEDYNALKAHAREISGRIEAARAAAEATPEGPEPDPWAGNPPAAAEATPENNPGPHPFAGLPGRDEKGDRADATA